MSSGFPYINQEYNQTMIKLITKLVKKEQSDNFNETSRPLITVLNSKQLVNIKRTGTKTNK